MKEIEEILRTVEEIDEGGFIIIGSWRYDDLVDKLQELIESKEKEAFEAGRKWDRKSQFACALFYKAFEDYKKIS